MFAAWRGIAVVQKEIEFFAAQGRHAKIFAIISDTAPLTDANSGDATLSCFPPAFRGDALSGDKLEPLAADARKGKDGFRNAWLKIVAGLVGVSPGQLIDRDRKRRTGDFIRAASIAALVVLVIGAAITQRLWRSELDRYLRYTRFVHSTADLAAARPGTQFQDCRQGSSDCPAMVVIPEGTFLMGDESGADPNAISRRIVVHSFAASRTEITLADWRACISAGGCDGYQPEHPGSGENFPVTNVSWEDAQKYADWLKRMTGHEYRLLTETEWEYAARGVRSADDVRNGESWSFGADESQLPRYAWFSGNSDQQTHPVATKRPNLFGLYDMHGNAQEWVEDCFSPYDPAKLDGAAIQTDSDATSTCTVRVIRGGSANDPPFFLRSAYRNWYVPTRRDADVYGFRVARTL